MECIFALTSFMSYQHRILIPSLEVLSGKISKSKSLHVEVNVWGFVFCYYYSGETLIYFCMKPDKREQVHLQPCLQSKVSGDIRLPCNSFR